MEYVWETGRLSVPAGVENEKSRVKKMINLFLTHPQSQIHGKSSIWQQTSLFKLYNCIQTASQGNLRTIKDNIESPTAVSLTIEKWTPSLISLRDWS